MLSRAVPARAIGAGRGYSCDTARVGARTAQSLLSLDFASLGIWTLIWDLAFP